MANMSSEVKYKDYVIRQLDAQRIKDVETLYPAVFGIKLRKGWLEAKFSTAYTGAQFIGYIAYDTADEPAAYYGVLPCLVRYGTEIILSAQSGDTMTHPRHRKQGLFVELSRMTFELCRSAGIRFIFGLPNQNAYPAMVGVLGWKEAGTLERFTIPVRTWRLEALFRRLGARRVYETYCRWVLRKRTLNRKGLANAVIGEGYGGVYRDERYLQYRRYNPTYVLKAGNALAWIRLRQALLIGDMEVTDAEFDDAMFQLEKTARRLGIPYVSFQTSRGTRLHTIFAARYRGETSFPVLIKDLGAGIPPEKLALTFADIDIF
jgi:hypothetical protein